MKYLYYIFIIALLVSSCEEDKPINYIYSSEKDSIEREEIFAALGDTVFADVLYGMNRPQAYGSLDAFRTSLSCYKGFQFAGTKFNDFELRDIEKVRTEELESYLYGSFYGYTLLYEDKLFKVIWHPYSNIDTHHSLEEIEKPINDFLAFFEKRYGKPNKKVESVSQLKNNQTIKYAVWKTENRCIEMNVWFEKYRDSSNPFKYKYFYSIGVQFYDPIVFKKVETYIEQRKFKLQEMYRYFEQEDSIKSSQAL